MFPNRQYAPGHIQGAHQAQCTDTDPLGPNSSRCRRRADKTLPRSQTPSQHLPIPQHSPPKLSRNPSSVICAASAASNTPAPAPTRSHPSLPAAATPGAPPASPRASPAGSRTSRGCAPRVSPPPTAAAPSSSSRPAGQHDLHGRPRRRVQGRRSRGHRQARPRCRGRRPRLAQRQQRHARRQRPRPDTAPHRGDRPDPRRRTLGPPARRLHGLAIAQNVGLNTVSTTRPPAPPTSSRPDPAARSIRLQAQLMGRAVAAWIPCARGRADGVTRGVPSGGSAASRRRRA